MRKSLAILAVGVACLVAACGDDSLSRDDARQQIMNDTGVSEEVAECVLDVMDELDLDYDAQSDDVPEEKRIEFTEKGTACRNP